MKIETHHIPSQGLVLHYQKQADEFVALKEMMAAGECRFKAVLDIELEVSPAQDYIEVAGQLNTVVELACSRCVAAYDQSLNHHFKLTYSKEIPKELHGDEEEGTEITAEQIGVIFFKGEVIDFTDALQEQVVIALPFKALCKETCKGLCPQCGTDWNKNTCSCEGEAASGPFDVLKGLKLSS